MKKLAALAAITAFLSVDLVGCATASDLDDGIVPGRRGDAGTGDADDEDADDEDGATDTGTAKDSSTGTDARTDGRTDAPSTDAKTDAKPTTDAKTDGGGTTCTALGTSECMAAENLGAVSGDSNADTVTKSGTGNAFVLVEVTEDDSTPFTKVALKVALTLKSTGGGNYDLYVYGGPAKGDVDANGWPANGIDCSTQEGSATTSSDDVVNVTWSDSQGITGHSDNRVLAIEIRSATATCSGGWDLTVEGNK